MTATYDGFWVSLVSSPLGTLTDDDLIALANAVELQSELIAPVCGLLANRQQFDIVAIIRRESESVAIAAAKLAFIEAIQQVVGRKVVPEITLKSSEARTVGAP